ncbi:hypothetical protein [Desulfogranum mediterraneum]|nr:hypothetical protein [Desulfogranum mediterraneum]
MNQVIPAGAEPSAASRGSPLDATRGQTNLVNRCHCVKCVKCVK